LNCTLHHICNCSRTFIYRGGEPSG